jgi:hypothetical protein
VTGMSDCRPDVMPNVAMSRDLPAGSRSASARAVRTLAPILVAAGAAACTGPPCQLDRFEDAPAAAPGQVRHGLALAQQADLSATATGVACLTCDGIYYFDPALSAQRHVAIDLAGTGELAVGGDTTFVCARDPGRGPEHPAHFQLSALSEAGRPLWHRDFGTGEMWQGAVGRQLLAGPSGAVLRGAALAAVFDPATGASRWITPVLPETTLAPDSKGGLFTALGDSQLGPANAEGALFHLEGTSGALTWGVLWPTSNMAPAVGGDLAFTGAAPGASGGVIVAGRFTTSALGIGNFELTITALPAHGSIDGTRFVAALDVAGRPLWGVAIGTSDASGRIDVQRIAALGDGAVICGDRAGAGQLGLPATDATTDAFVARIDPDGAIAAHAISGDGDQTCEALAVAPDGSATIAVHSARGPGGSELRVGGQIFDDGPEKTFYVLNLVP